MKEVPQTWWKDTLHARITALDREVNAMAELGRSLTQKERRKLAEVGTQMMLLTIEYLRQP